MPGKAQNPDSWFYGTRLRAGFRNAASLAERLGVPKGTVYQWERGSERQARSYRPSGESMLKLEDALGVPLEELVARLWGEKLGNPAPCGCGRLAFPDNPTAHRLVVKLPCIQCGKERTYPQGKHYRHRQRCGDCANSVERKVCICDGYENLDATRYARRCPRRIYRRPSDINARKRIKKRLGKRSVFYFDRGTGMYHYQCNACAGAARLTAWQKNWLVAKKKGRPLKEILEESKGRIRTREHRRKVFMERRVMKEVPLEARRRGHQKISLRSIARQMRKRGMPETSILEALQGKNKTFRDPLLSAKEIEAIAATVPRNEPDRIKANLRRRWVPKPGKELPKPSRFGLRFDICIYCNELLPTRSSHVQKFHHDCHNEWQRTREGRLYQSRRKRGLEANLPHKRPGRPLTEENLAESFSWVFQHYPEGKPYSTIAKEKDLDPSAVERRVEEMVKRLRRLLASGRKVDSRFRRTIEFVLLEVDKKAASRLSPALSTPDAPSGPLPVWA